MNEMEFIKRRFDAGDELAAFVVLRMDHTFTEQVECRVHTSNPLWTSKDDDWDTMRYIIQWSLENGMKIVNDQRETWREELREAGML